jgi:uncharacterized protein YjfI (DUF2170 family)
VGIASQFIKENLYKCERNVFESPLSLLRYIVLKVPDGRPLVL